MREWLGGIAGMLCVMTVILQIVPEGSFSKYVRFYISLLYLLAVAGPLLRLISQEDTLERFLKLELLKEEHYDLETSVEGLQELKNESFRTAWRNEILRQIGEITAAYGGTMEAGDISLGEDDTLQGVNIKISTEEGSGDQIAEQIRKEISGIYSLAPERIQIARPGGR